MTLLEKLKEILPKPIYYIVSLIILLCVFISNILVYYVINYFIISQYLIDTPFILVALILSISIFFISLQNYETLFRLSQIVSVLAFIMLSINVIGVFKFVNLINVLPIYNFENISILKTSILYTAYFTTPFFLLTFIKKSNIIDSENLNKKIIKTSIISGLIIILILFIILSTSGIDLIELFYYPEYMVLKKIKISFVESIENLCFMLWDLYAFIFCALSTLYLKYSITSLFNIKEHKTKNIIPILLFASVSILPIFLLKNAPSITEKIYYYSPIILFLIFLTVLLFLYITSLLKKKGIENPPQI